MEVTKEFIKGAIGLLIAVALCLVMVMIYRKGNSSINASIEKYDSLVSGFETEKYSRFDGKNVTGTALIGLLNDISENEDIVVIVKNGHAKKYNSSVTYTYSSLRSSGSSLLRDIEDINDDVHYINPAAYFAATLQYNDNGGVSSLLFVQI